MGHRKVIKICKADNIQHFGFLDHYKINTLKTVFEKLPVTSFQYSSIDITITCDTFSTTLHWKKVLLTSLLNRAKKPQIYQLTFSYGLSQ